MTYKLWLYNLSFRNCAIKSSFFGSNPLSWNFISHLTHLHLHGGEAVFRDIWIMFENPYLSIVPSNPHTFMYITGFRGRSRSILISCRISYVTKQSRDIWMVPQNPHLWSLPSNPHFFWKVSTYKDIFGQSG